MTPAQRTLANLRELQALTADEHGAQRLAWSACWRQARTWLRGKASELGLTVQTDSAGNDWYTLAGQSSQSLLLGSHLDSVPNGGWLDGCLGVLAGLEVLRQHAGTRPPLTLRLVDFADEEGRFARSLLGSSAAAGTLVPDAVRQLTDKTGVRLVDALQENGIELERMPAAHAEFKRLDIRAYLELHIEQGPVLETLGKAAGVVTGTFGVRRHHFRFVGQAAHSGSTPLPMRRDAFLAAAEFALACREIAREHSRPEAGVVCTVGQVRVQPDIATAVPGVAEISLDQQALTAPVLAAMWLAAQDAALRCAQANRAAVSWSPLFQLDPRPFAADLMLLCEQALREVTGDAPRLPSGPLHDASELAPLVPTVMMFASSTGGLSHCKEEDTPVEHLEQSIQAFLLLADKVMQRLGGRQT